MKDYLVKNATVIDSGRKFLSDIFIKSGRFSLLAPVIDNLKVNHEEIDAEGKFIIPGIIDVHVHFRDPGLTYKGDIFTESKAAAAGGVTSFIDMPNTLPPAVSNKILDEKFVIASQKSLINYSFYLGATNNNLDELLRAKENGAAGIKLFLGSSTGNMLVNDNKIIDRIFSSVNHLIVVHAEDEIIINKNFLKYKERFGDNIPIKYHEKIRPEEACFASFLNAFGLATKYGARLHFAHISTKSEASLLTNNLPLKDKKITAETGIQYLYFDSRDYEKFGSEIKCNPSIKGEKNKIALFEALLDDRIDLIASDHAPHLKEEKNQPYTNCPSGIPLIQYSLPVMLEYYHNEKISIEIIVEKMCHAPAVSHHISERGFIREGYFADFVIFDLDKKSKVSKKNIYSKCNWSPFEGMKFNSSIEKTFVNGNLVFDEGKFSEIFTGKRLEFQNILNNGKTRTY